MWPVDLFSSTGNFYIMTITGPGSKFIRTIPRAIRKFITDHVGLRTVGLVPHLTVGELIVFGSFSGHFGPKRTRKMAVTGRIQFQCQKTQNPQKICENWVLLVFHSQNCWGIISSGFLQKHIGIWEFGHVLGSSRPLCGPTWSVMNFRNVRWVEPMN